MSLGFLIVPPGHKERLLVRRITLSFVIMCIPQQWDYSDESLFGEHCILSHGLCCTTLEFVVQIT